MDSNKLQIFQKFNAETCEANQKINSIKPYQRPFKDYFKTLSIYENAKNTTDIEKESNISAQKIYQITPEKHCSLKQLNELTPILLKDLKVNQVHYGRYLLCRTIAEPFYFNCMNLLIEDEDDQIENVCFYNYANIFEIEPKSLIQVNSVLIIKEPYLKIMVSNQNEFYILIESPSDVIFLNDSHSIEKWKTKDNFSFEDLNSLGNKHFSLRDYEIAIRYYTKALNVKQDIKAYKNRAAAYLNLEKYFQAYQDCVSSCKIEPNEKAYFRMGKSLYNMRQFDEALNSFKKCLELNKINLEALNELNRTKQRLEEAKTGKYDVKKLIEDCRNGMLRLDVADYFSNQIEIIDARKSRKVIAKNEIKRGTLLIASKAASISYNKECKSQVLSVNYFTQKIDMPSKSQNISKIFYKIQNDPYLAKDLYKLYAGEKFDHTTPIEDSIVHVSRIEAILTYNSFQSIPLEFVSNFNPEPNDLEDNSGIWITPSYLNHSCLPNTQRIYFNDFVMFYASVDIKKGDEITTFYIENIEPFQERDKFFSEYGFKCTCKLCELDRNDPKSEFRDSYLLSNRDRIKKMAVENGKDVEEALRFFNTIKESYGDRREFRYALSLPLVYLGMFYRNDGKLDKSARVYMELYDLCKDYQERLAFYGLVEAINDYFLWFDLDMAKISYRIAKKYSLGDKEYFLHRCDAKIIDYENIQSLIDN